MEQFIHTFRDNGNLSVYNDDVMPRTFDLEGSAFRFNLFPSNETKGWRFGIVLSEDENFSHLPFKGRYNDKTLRFMQANFNRKNANGWILENRVYLEMFNVDNENVIPWEFPQQKRPEFIRVELRRAANNNDLIFLVKTNEKDFMCRPIPLPGYRYFKLAVWADESPFELECRGIVGYEQRVNLPLVPLSKNKRAYLEMVYQQFINHLGGVSKYELSQFWNEFPSKFDPNEIDPSLLYGEDNITLFGIWQIDPWSDLFSRIDDLIIVIKNILSSGNINTPITEAQLLGSLKQ